jgi:signal transduction histidine kinase
MLTLFTSFGCVNATVNPEDNINVKRILFIHSFGPLYKPWSDYGRAIRAEIAHQSPWPIDVFDHSLVDARSTSQQSEGPLVKYLQALYATQPPDLIIAIGAPAASFIQRHRSELFSNIPMIFTAVDQRRVDYSLLSENDTVVPVTHDFAAAFRTILQVLPDTKTIAIVNGASPNERYWHKEIQREVSSYEDRVTLKWYDELPFAEILKDAAKLPANSVIFWHLMNVDAAGIAYEANDSLNALASVASAPIFSYDDSFFEGALLGGVMFSVAESSLVTAKVAIRILSGEKAGNIKNPAIGFALPRFDWRQMQKWGIAESALPPGSTVYFRSPGFWDVYRWYIILAVATILLQGCLIGALVWERRRRSRAEAESRQRLTELAHVNRYYMAGELTAAIAHEINQPLGAILSNAEAATLILRSATPDIPALREIVGNILDNDERASKVIRRIRSLLKKAPFELRDLDLNDLVRESVDFLSTAVRSRNALLFSTTATDPLPIQGDRIQLQQVILNLVMNAVDAMEARPDDNQVIHIRTSRVGDFAELSVSDNGPGIPEDKLKEIFEPFFTTKEAGMGMGLSIARTIIESHKGTIEARSQGGAQFIIRLPCGTRSRAPVRMLM